MTMIKLLIGIVLLCLSRVLLLIRATSTVQPERGPIDFVGPSRQLAAEFARQADEARKDLR